MFQDASNPTSGMILFVSKNRLRLQWICYIVIRSLTGRRRIQQQYYHNLMRALARFHVERTLGTKCKRSYSLYGGSFRQQKDVIKNSPKFSSSSSPLSFILTTYPASKKSRISSQSILSLATYLLETVPTTYLHTACTEGFTSYFGFCSLQCGFGMLNPTGII